MYAHLYGVFMKTIWNIALAAAITVALSGCMGGEQVKPVGVQKVQATATPEPSATLIAEPVVPVDVVPAPVAAPVAGPIAPTTATVSAPAQPPAVPVAPAPTPSSAPAAPVAPLPAVPVAPIQAPVASTAPAPAPSDPFAEWLKHPTFTCEPGRAPGWLDENGIPTSCVAN